MDWNGLHLLSCAVFQVIFGLMSSSLSSYLFLLKPRGCGNESIPCGKHSSWEMGMFNLSIYLIALGNGGYPPNIATFGADQFDEEHSREGHNKVVSFSYFYLALNFGQLFSNTLLVCFEDEGMWAELTGKFSWNLQLFRVIFGCLVNCKIMADVESFLRGLRVVSVMV